MSEPTEATATASPPAIELRDIVKRFPGVVANDGVDLTVAAGTVHAIVGENGAGKSTLMKTLYGAHRPDEGMIAVDGVERTFRSPSDAIAAGIGMVFQHFMLADNLTVWENIVLGHEPTRGWLSPRRVRRSIRELAQRYGFDIDPDELVADLGVGEKQRVEILKVLYRGARILILDEPTAVLVPHEVNELFASLRELTDQGATVVFISHKLDEVLTHAQAITIIRAGRTVAEIDDPSSVDARELAELMVGNELPSPETRQRTVTDRIMLEATDLTIDTPSALPSTWSANAAVGDGDVITDGPVIETAIGHRPLDGVSLRVHAGEIVGIAGVEGNGQTELIEALMGVETASGTVQLGGTDITKLSTLGRRRAGLACIAEDRQRDGMVLTFSLWENVLLGRQGGPPFVSGGMVRRPTVKDVTAEIVDRFDVRTPGINVAAFTLSGGNQQKLIVGRELGSRPVVLLAAHPTRGVDVGAQALIWDVLRDAREAGLATLLVSADLEELIGLSDRILVMLRGRVVAEVDPATTTPAELGSLMTGATA